MKSIATFQFGFFAIFTLFCLPSKHLTANDINRLVDNNIKQSKVELVQQGRWNQGPVFASVTYKDVMYFGSSGTVRAVKVIKDGLGKPIAWNDLSSLPTEGVIRDMLAHDNTLYIADGSGWLRILDINNPKEMQLLGAYQMNRNIRGIAYHEEKIYLAAEWGGLLIIDVSDKTDPKEVTALKAGYALDVVIENSVAYIAGGHKGLFFVDISQPEQPKLMSTFEISGSSAGIDVKDNLVYVVNMDDADPALSIIDVSDVTQPKKIASETLIYGAERVRVDGSLVYVAGVANDAGLIIIDVLDPKKPKKLGSWWDPTCSESVYIDDGMAYLAHGDQGLEILDVTDPNEPKVIEHFAAAGHVRNLDTKANLAYLANGYRGIKIVDTSNKNNLQTLSEIKTYRALDVDVFGDYAHVADDWAGYKLIDISDPQKPSLVAELDTPGYAEDVFATKQLAYVASGEGGLRIIHYQDDKELKEIAAVEVPEAYAYEVFVKGDKAYLAAGKAGLIVINISNPSSPVIESSFKLNDRNFEARGIVVRGNNAYLSSSYIGIMVLDVSDSKKITELGRFKTKRSARHLKLDGNLAYVIDSDFMRVLDVSNPVAIQDVYEVSLPARSAKVHLNGDDVYVAGMESGMVVFEKR